MKSKYLNIAISGLPGAGSTTLAQELAKHLGWKFYSGGGFMREYAIKMGYFDPKETTHHAATVYPNDFDRQCDYSVRENMVKEEHCVYESWLAGFLAQGVKGTFKILCICSDDSVRVDRLANRDGLTIDQAKEHVFERERQNVEKWQKMYAKEWQEWVVKPGFVAPDKPQYYWYPEMYDLVIDTYKYSRQETLDLAYRAVTE